MATPSFYDGLAPYYHLLHADWARSITEQGTALANLLQSHGIHPGEPILDAACGIGTQTIGLVAQGYHVTASDISPGAVKRLGAELSSRGLRAEVRVDDMLTLGRTGSASVAAVLACDNSVPHLLTDDEIVEAFRSCFRCLRPNGIIILSVRDYASIPRTSPDVRPYCLRYEGECRFLAVQVWEWEEDQYDLRMYLTFEAPDGSCATQMLVSRYYAVTIDHLLLLLNKAGFVEATRIDHVLHQPVLFARRPSVV